MTSARPSPFTAGQAQPSVGGVGSGREGRLPGGQLWAGRVACAARRTRARHHGLAQRAGQADGGRHDAPHQAPRRHDVRPVVAVAQDAAQGRRERLECVCGGWGWDGGGQGQGECVAGWGGVGYCSVRLHPACAAPHLHQRAAQGQRAQLRQAHAQRLANEQVDLRVKGGGEGVRAAAVGC